MPPVLAAIPYTTFPTIDLGVVEIRTFGLMVALGVMLGAVLTLIAARLLSGLLFGVAALSVAPYLAVTGLLAAVSVIACLVPARRAMQIDPAIALRAD